MTPDLATLIERLERASGPDRALDLDISHYGKQKFAHEGKGIGWPPHYTASIDAALTLVGEKHLYGLNLFILDGDGTDGRKFVCSSQVPLAISLGRSWPLAIALYALRAPTKEGVRS